jgi:KaiC/GvpD/RAD55 family RecA-like ATPase
MLKVVSSPGTSRRPKPQLQEGRASTGVEQLDKLLKGGLTYGNSVLVTYENFTYGDLLSVYLLRGGIESKEKVYLVLNGIDEEAFWQMTKKTYVKFEPEEIFDLKGKGVLKVMQVQDFNEFQMVVDEYINAPKDEASRMIVYTINSFIYSENFINFITQFSSLKYMFDGTKKNIFLFLTEYSDRSDLQRVYSICKGIIQFKVQELEDRINLRLRVQGLSNEVQSWLGYYITDDGAFQIESPNIRRV